MKISVKTSGSGTLLLLRATWDDLKFLNTQTTLLINYGRNSGVEPGTRAAMCFHPFGRMLGCPAGYRGAEGGVIIRHQKMHVKEPQWQMWGRREGISREFRKDHSRMAAQLVGCSAHTNYCFDKVGSFFLSPCKGLMQPSLRTSVFKCSSVPDSLSKDWFFVIKFKVVYDKWTKNMTIL